MRSHDNNGVNLVSMEYYAMIFCWN